MDKKNINKDFYMQFYKGIHYFFLKKYPNKIKSRDGLNYKDSKPSLLFLYQITFLQSDTGIFFKRITDSARRADFSFNLKEFHFFPEE